MARAIHKLTAREVETMVKPGRHSDGGGLYLFISPDGRRRWTFMYTWRGKQREAGLGRAPEKKAANAKEAESRDVVSLKAAPERAAEGRALIKSGVDPIAEWNKPDAEAVPTFGEAADDFIEAHKGGWRNDKHKAQWTMTLTTYCEAIRKTPVDAIDTEAVLSVLKPLWSRAPETASRLRGRIEAVLDAAKARGFIGRNEANPARWRGHPDKLLPKRDKLTRGHYAAMPYADVPAFVAGLRERPATAARALEFAILTATRSGETLAARWEEIDLDAKVWTVPAERTKAARDHRVPLSDRALAILAEMKAARTGDYVFPGPKPKRPLSNMAFEMLLRRAKSDYTAHGFRSSFRDWAGNETHFPREVAEHALAHVIGDKAEQAYGAPTRSPAGVS
ncbi:MAG TPA: integrase arm-type DNA-binding domain-containing protein [Roseiarcus sp.]|jgi:integrase